MGERDECTTLQHFAKTGKKLCQNWKKLKEIIVIFRLWKGFKFFKAFNFCNDGKSRGNRVTEQLNTKILILKISFS